jgi:flavin reductase (DIM6/NTAB) family NADH-FMN oxidoreductase RutF
MTEQQKNSIGKVLGRVVSGVYIITASHEGRSGAMLASWAMQAGFEPPAITIAIAKGRPVAELIRGSGTLALSIIPAEDKSLMKHYARLKPGDDPFAGVQTRPSALGIPILSDALGYLEGRIRQFVDAGIDHDLCIVEVTGAEILREGAAFAHQRGNGFHY